MKAENNSVENNTEPVYEVLPLRKLFSGVVVMYLAASIVGFYVCELFFYDMHEANRMMIAAILSRIIMIASMLQLLMGTELRMAHREHLARQIFVILFAFVLSFVIGILPGYFMDTFSLTGVFGSETAANDLGEGSHFALQFIAGVLFMVVAEELIFRGAIFKALRENKGFWAGAIISSALFALLHGINLLMIIAFFVGMLLCFIYERTGNILVPILVHMLHNALGVIGNRIGPNPISSENGLLFHSMAGNLLFLFGMTFIGVGLLMSILKVTEGMKKAARCRRA